MLSTILSELKKTEEHLHNEFAKLQVGRANPALVEGILINAYGGIQPLKNIASVGVLDSQTLSIQPWDKALIRDIDKGISDAGLGLNPQNNGETIMIKTPILTQERRLELVKVAKKISEDNRISVRNIRHEYLKKIKQAETNKEIGEDIAHSQEKELQKFIDDTIEKIDQSLKHKEEEIMKI